MEPEKQRKFRVGDLIHEVHFPKRMGIVVEVVEPEKLQWALEVFVEWVVDNPNQHGTGPEQIEERYINLVTRRGQK